MIDVFDGANCSPPLGLLWRFAETCVTTGEIILGRKAIARGVETIATMKSQGRPVPEEDEFDVSLWQARVSALVGKDDAALSLFKRAQSIAEQRGDRMGVAVTLGDIASLSDQRGNVDEALQIQEQRLQIYQELGIRRGQAIALGDIARLLAQKGELNQAIQMHQEKLQIYRALNDQDSIGGALGDIAGLLAQKSEVDQAIAMHQQQHKIYRVQEDWVGVANANLEIAKIELARNNRTNAMRLLQEAYDIATRVGRLEGLEVSCMIGQSLGPLLVADGQRDQGLTVLRASADGYRDLGRADDAEQVEAILCQIEQANKMPDD